MTTSFAPLKIRRALNREFTHDFVSRPFAYGPDGWTFYLLKGPDTVKQEVKGSIFVSAADLEPGIDWIHASVSRVDRMPSYLDLKALHLAVFPGYAYQLFVPEETHINIHETALHLWGRLDGKPAMIDPGKLLGRI